jgi:hypothetical protein
MKSKYFAPQATQISSLKNRGYHCAIHSTGLATICWKQETVRENVRFYVMIFTPKADRPALNCYFSKQSSAEKYIGEMIQRMHDRKESTEKIKAERKAYDATKYWVVGDVVYNSWGYDQTNVDYYQVTRVTKGCIWIRRIAANSSDRGQPGGGKCFPCRGEFTGEEIKKNVTSEYVSFRCGSGSKWDGRAKYCSSDR